MNLLHSHLADTIAFQKFVSYVIVYATTLCARTTTRWEYLVTIIISLTHTRYPILFFLNVSVGVVCMGEGYNHCGERG